MKYAPNYTQPTNPSLMPNYISPEEEAHQKQEEIKRQAKIKQAKEFMFHLNIPTFDLGTVFNYIDLLTLYDILNDPDKVKELIFKLNNKALW